MRTSPSSRASAASAVTVAAAILAASPAAADLGEIKARGSLRVLVGTNEQPEMFAFEGPRPGFEREVLEGFARQYKLRLEVVAVRNRHDRVPALRRGEGDIVVGLVVTPARQQLVEFSTQILPAPHVVVTLAPNRPVKTVGELRDERIGAAGAAVLSSDHQGNQRPLVHIPVHRPEQAPRSGLAARGARRSAP